MYYKQIHIAFIRVRYYFSSFISLEYTMNWYGYKTIICIIQNSCHQCNEDPNEKHIHICKKIEPKTKPDV